MKKMFIMAGLVFIFGYAADYVYCAPKNLMDTKETKQATEKAKIEAEKEAEQNIEQAPIKAVLKQIYDKLGKGEPPETIITDIKDTLQANPDIKDKLFTTIVVKAFNEKLVDIIANAGNDYASVIGYIGGIIDLNDSNYWGWRHPLCQAALEGYDKVVEELLNYIDPNVKDKDDWTALHWAALKGHISIIDILLNHPKTNLNAKGEFGYRTALYLAMYKRQIKAVKLLLIYGAGTDGLDEYQKKFVNKVLRDMNIDRERKDKFNELISEQRYVGALRIFSLIETKTQNKIFKNLGIKHRERLEKQLGYLFNSEILPFFTPSAAASEVQEEAIE